jgi:MuDR family transposase
MASLSELVRPVDGAEFDDIEALLAALDDWAVKDKFTFRTLKREPGRAVWVCAEENCPWRVRSGAVDGEDGLVVLVVVNSEHHCIARGIRKFSSSLKKDWLDRVVSRHLNVTRATSPRDIVDLLSIRFAEEMTTSGHRCVVCAFLRRISVHNGIASSCCRRI